MIYYLLFLRITPLLPNWFINISSPILEVPLWKFFIATFLGLMPMNVMHVKTGLMINDIQTVGGVDLKVRISSSRIANLTIDSSYAVCHWIHCFAAYVFQEETTRKV